MTTREYIELDSVFLLFLFALAGIAFAVVTNHVPKIRSSFSLPVMEAIQSPVPTAIPLPKTTSFSQPSPDGTKKLTLTITANKDNVHVYTVSASDGDGTNKQTVYTTTLPEGESLSIPFNTWSPDNRYFFIEHTTPKGKEALTFRQIGQSLTDDEPYLNITSIFNGKNTGNTYQETTGWASETLLIVNTISAGGSKGPSYWVEVPSKAVIQLSTEF